MAVGKSKKAQVSSDENGEKRVKRIPQGSSLQWVSANLNSGDKDWLRANVNHAMEFVAELLEELDESFSLSVKFDDKSRKYLSVLVCTAAEHEGAGCAISMRGATPFDSLYALAYYVGARSSEPWWVGAGNEFSDPWG